MKENKYDNEKFFKKYAEMERSKKGLEGAGEWYELKKILPDFNNKKVLDLGCGYGWHCSYASDNGADLVIGTDISEKMLEEARNKNNRENINYICMAMEDINYQDEFDIIISSLAIHYIENFNELLSKIYKSLKTNGEFIFSVEHPVFTAEGKQDWYYDENGNIMHFPVDNYYYEGKRNAVFLGENVTKYHRTITTYIDTLLREGFELKRVVEPKPPEEMMYIDGMKDEMRRPMMLIISAVKK